MKRLVYRIPYAHYKKIKRLGVAGYFLLDRWAAEMERSVASLPPLEEHGGPADLWYLTGAHFWYQTAYCAWTFGRHSGRSVRLHLVDDGTLTPDHTRALKRLFGTVEVISAEVSAVNLKQRLPPARYPTLNLRWHDYVHLRKLIDVHCGREGPRLVLDSDMLFFSRPEALLNWLDAGDRRPMVYMTDCAESYGYSRALITNLVSAELPEKLNVGVCGLTSEQIDWKLLEEWSAHLLSQEGTSYYLEQALVAMIAARTECLQLPLTDYITLPTRQQITDGVGVLQHYVASSKSDYFQYAWRLARARCGVLS